MIHSPDHEPTLMHRECWICAQALSAAIAKLSGYKLGPSNTSALIDKLNKEAKDYIAFGAAS